MDKIEQSEIKNNASMVKLLDRLVEMGPAIAHNPAARKVAVSVAERWMNRSFDLYRKKTDDPQGVILDKEAMTTAILHSIERGMTEYHLSDATVRGITTILGRDLFVERKAREARCEEFRAQYGFSQPSFLVLSPSRACNLRCSGCYADSDTTPQTLEWDMVDRIVAEAEDLWAAQFMVISGGEPMAYRSQGKTILDLAENHPNVFFMMYTNGTLIDDEVAARMSRLGNIMPAISLEGWQERTDARRGAGTFVRVMAAMDRLFAANVPFGISLTATRQNAEEILSDEFLDMLFFEKHALFGWLFQYMPIGRSFTLDLMPSPQQRIEMWRKSWDYIRRKKVFLADFWNHGTVVDGCLSAGGHGKGGYLYIEWNGNITPCVFVPYSAANIKEVYARGGDLNDVYNEPFFKSIRKWQTESARGNLLAPCLIRDHHEDLRRMMRDHEPDPLDGNAQAALQDADYEHGLEKYAHEFRGLADAVWTKEYTGQGTHRQ